MADARPIRRVRALAAMALALSGAAPPEGGALGRLAEEIAAQAAAGAALDRVAVAVAAPGVEPLEGPFAAALAAALARRGGAPLPLRGPGPPEAAARAASADRLLRARLALTGADLACTAELLTLRENFFLQRYPAESVRLLSASMPADAAARALVRPGPPRRPGVPVLVPLFEMKEAVLALAVDGSGEVPTLLAAVPEGLLLLSAAGERLAFRAAAPPPAPLRAPGAALAAGDFGSGRVAWRLAGMAEAEVLDLSGGRLRPVAALAAAPLAAGGAGALFGAFAPGLPLFLDQVTRGIDPAARPRSSRLLFGAAAAPRPGRAAFAVLRTDDVVEILGADLAPAAPPVDGVGAGFALADLDGDGEPELIASAAAPGAEDRIRVVRLAGRVETPAPPLALSGQVLAAATGDLTGDRVDDVVLAAAVPPGGTRLWLLSADPREPRR